jgi:hypothetical protein
MPFPIFESNNRLLKPLLDDCGGHGRAIERKHESEPSSLGIQNSSINTEINWLYRK